MLTPPPLCWSQAGGCGGEEGSATFSWEGFRSLLKIIHGAKRRQRGPGGQCKAQQGGYMGTRAPSGATGPE